jgi:multidrug efflux system outer membrane protein
VSWRAPSLALAAATLLTGCAHETAADRAPRPDPVARLAPTGEPAWRDDLGDPELRDLLRRADAGALDIKIALARLERAQAEADAAHAAKRPQLAVGVFSAVGGRDLETERSAASPTAEVTYELDLSGRIASLARAAAAERQATAAEVAGARLLVAAETAQGYVALCAADDALVAAERRRDAAERTLALADARVAEGAATALDIEGFAAGAESAAARAQAARAAADASAVRLRTVLGGAELPARPACALTDVAPSQAPVPANRADARPDVQAAFARLQAADSRRAAAVAAERPQFQITALLGAPDAEIATLLDSRGLAWALAARVGETLFDGGAGRARIRAATAEADLADLAYRKAVLQAWTELQTAAVEAAEARDELAGAQDAVRRAEARVGVTRARHAEGAADGLAVAEAEARLEEARDGLRQARIRAAGARIQRTLAGGGQ